VRLLLCAALLLTATPALAADPPTCQDVIDAKDAPAMRADVDMYRAAVLRGAALNKAQQLNVRLKEDGIVNAYQISVESYEAKFMPARDHAEEFWKSLEKAHGGMSAAFAEVCNPSDMDVDNFYLQFYDVVLEQMK
jgi:hypothetical protein